MQLDIINKIYIVLSPEGTFIKFNLWPSSDLKSKMALGTVAMREDEAMRLYAGLRAHFENTELPDYVAIKDLRQMKKVNDEFRIKREQSKTEPISAEQMQRENLMAEGRLEPQPLGEVAEIKRKKEETN